ncbi:MAG: hypothetical protein MUP33_03090, partial [Polaromonas sp.]|nr:hypothetical protein [Polaromonas sp.]
MLNKFVFSAALSAALCSALVAPAAAQNTSASPGAGDSLIVEMNKAFKRGDKLRLAQLLPQAKGHALEPWAAYWELKARLEDATPQEVQGFMARYAGSYQEDRLRNDWLLLLGQRRDWAGFSAEYPNFRMNDDREVRCYALLVEHVKNPVMDAALSSEVRSNWQSQRDAGDGCTAAAERLVGARNLTPQDVWHKARLALEANVSLHDPVDFEETPGKGVYANVDGAAILVGRDSFLQENNIDISNVRDPLLHEDQGFSTLYIACDNECIGWVGMQDKTRPE